MQRVIQDFSALLLGKKVVKSMTDDLLVMSKSHRFSK